ncbi:TnsD family Tn7-like transposition protein [Desulfosporosinus hippei]|nr:TnsD family Tn7-like transposition protein [Desulfosporosinus hippei]
MYPDEDIRSIIYRYRAWRCSTGVKVARLDWIMQELFNTYSGTIPINPPNLEYLISKLPKGTINIKQLVDQHTYFPLERLVSSKERSTNLLNNIKKLMSKPSEKRSHSSLIIESEMRYCPKCLEEDMFKYGEGYIHRSHQLKYLNVCSKHELYLFSRCTICLELIATSRGRFDLHSAYCSNGHDLRIVETTSVKRNNQLENIKLQVVRDAEFILNNNDQKDHDFLRDMYKYYLINEGFVNTNGNYRTQQFINLFLKKYPPDMLKVLGVPIYNVRNYLPQGLVELRKGLSNFLILSILMMKFFADSTKNFFFTKPPALLSKIPFGNGPWNCENKVCSNYHESTIVSCVREPYNFYDSNSLRATFKCPVCEYTYAKYSRNGQETQKVTVLRYGTLWENKLIEIYLDTKDFTISAELLGVSKETVGIQVARLLPSNLEIYSVGWLKELMEAYARKQTVAAAARQFGISSCQVKKIRFMITERQSNGMESSQAMAEVSAALLIPKSRQEKARKQILTIVSEDKHMTRRTIRQKCSKDYDWMMKYDQEWMTSVLPPIQRKGRPRKNWTEIDDNMAINVAQAGRDLLYQNPRRQLTAHFICNALPALQRNYIFGRSAQERFPKTMEQLNAIVESKEDYQIRLLSRVNEILKEQGMIVNVKNILNTRQYKGCSDFVRMHVEKIFSS